MHASDKNDGNNSHSNEKGERASKHASGKNIESNEKPVATAARRQDGAAAGDDAQHEARANRHERYTTDEVSLIFLIISLKEKCHELS